MTDTKRLTDESRPRPVQDGRDTKEQFQTSNTNLINWSLASYFYCQIKEKSHRTYSMFLQLARTNLLSFFESAFMLNTQSCWLSTFITYTEVKSSSDLIPLGLFKDNSLSQQGYHRCSKALERKEGMESQSKMLHLSQKCFRDTRVIKSSNKTEFGVADWSCVHWYILSICE